jgi:formylmethanofuran dehydrogenase subunit E
MADQLDDDRDEEWFKEVYGTEYTGPPKAPRGGDTRREVAPAAKANNKRLSTNVSDSEDEDEPRDPNAVPTDFTSREAKVWEAKAKAVERNWKRRKEEELTCHLCGEVGHFSQVFLSSLEP